MLLWFCAAEAGKRAEYPRHNKKRKAGLFGMAMGNSSAAAGAGIHAQIFAGGCWLTHPTCLEPLRAWPEYVLNARLKIQPKEMGAVHLACVVPQDNQLSGKNQSWVFQPDT